MKVIQLWVEKKLWENSIVVAWINTANSPRITFLSMELLENYPL